jgi:hypothetical protein
MKSFKKYIAALTIITVAAMGCSKDGNEATTLGNKNDQGTGQGGSLARFALVGNHMYAVNGRSLKVFDLSNRLNPSFVKSAPIGADVETIFARDNSTLFIGARSGMFVYDVSNGAEVQLIDSYQHITSCDPVVANSDYAYVTLRTRQESDNTNCGVSNVNQLDVVDIRNLGNMRVVNEMPMEFPIGLGLHGDTLMVCDNGLKVYDVTDGANPVLLMKEDVKAVDIIPYGDLMIVSTISGITQYRFKNGKLEFLSRI